HYNDQNEPVFVEEGFQVPSSTATLKVQVDGGDFGGGAANSFDAFFDNLELFPSTLQESSVMFAFGNSSGNFTDQGGGFLSTSKYDAKRFKNTVDTTALQDGAYTLWMNASDQAGNEGMDAVTNIEIDNTPPSITFDDPSGGETLSGTEYFNVTISDNLGNNDSSTYEYQLETASGATEVGYTDLTHDSGDKYYAKIDTTNYAGGDYVFRVRAQDSENNQNSGSITVNFDNNPPFIDIKKPDPGTHHRQNITVRAKITDAAGNEDPPTYECTLGSLTWRDMALDTGTTYTCEINTTNVPDGSRQVKVRANDTLDNRNTSSVSITVDNTDPAINAVNSNDSVVQTGMAIKVWADVTDSIDLTSVTADGISLSDNSTHWVGTVTGEADQTVNITATDRAGNIRTDNSTSYTIDNMRPSASGLDSNDTNDIVQQDQLLRFNVTVSDEHLRAAKIENASSGGFVQMTNTTPVQRYTFVARPEELGFLAGSVNMTAIGVDEAENVGDTYYEFQIDDNPPDVQHVRFNDSIVQTGSKITVNATVSDDNLLDVEVNGQTMEQQGAYWVETVIAGSTANPVNVTARDKGQNIGWNDTQTFTIDDTPPQAGTPTSDASFNTSRSDTMVRFTLGSATDNVRIDNVTLRNATDGTFIGTTNNSGTYTVSVTPASIGCPTGQDTATCEVAFRVLDEASLGTYANLTFTTDDVIPSVTNVSANTTVVQSGEAVRFTANISDASLNRTELRNSGSIACNLQPTTGTGYACSTTVSSDTTFTFWAEDRAANVNDTQQIFIDVDDEPPTITGFGSNSSYNTSDPQFLVRFGANVTDQHLETVEVKNRSSGMYLATVNASGTGYRLDANPGELGCPLGAFVPCNITMRATDAAGNVQKENYTHYIDNDVPTINEVIPNDTIVQSGVPISLRVNVSGEDDTSLLWVQAEQEIAGNNLTWNGTHWTGIITADSAADHDGFFNISATDRAPHTGINDSVSYIVDDQNPSIGNFDSSASFDTSRSDVAVTFSVDAQDNVGIANVTVTNKTSGKQIQMEKQGGASSISYAITATPEALGCQTGVNFETCTLTATAVDNASNTASTTYDLRIDDVPPDVNEVVINDSIIKPDFHVSTRVNVSGEGSTQLWYVQAEPSQTGNNLTWNGTHWTANITIDNDGFFNVSARDRAGNVDRNDSVNYTVDADIPFITNLTANTSDDIVANDTLLHFTVNATDEHGLASVTVDGFSMTDSGNYWTVEMTPSQLGCQDNGYCNLTATAEDNAGWTNATNYSLLIDSRPPDVWGLDSNASAGTPESASANFLLEWRVNATDTTNLTIILDGLNASTNVSVHPNTSFMNLSQTFPGRNVYTDIKKPAYFNTTNGTYRYRATAIDRAGNTNFTDYLIEITAQPPQVQRIFATEPWPEVLRGQTGVSANVTDPNAEISWIRANITWNGGFNYTNMTLVDPYAGAEIDGGVYRVNFTPPVAGWYNITIRGKNSVNKFIRRDNVRANAFRAIGKAHGTINSTPDLTARFDNVTQNGSAWFIQTLNLTNTRNATLYDAEIASPPQKQGIIPNISTDRNCGNLETGEFCTLVANITVTADAAPENESYSVTASWTNPDRTTSIDASFTQIWLLKNPVLRELTAGKVREQVFYNTSTRIHNLTVFSAGNYRIENLSYRISKVYSANTMQPRFIRFIDPDRKKLDPGLVEEVPVNVTIDTNLGPYSFLITENATGSYMEECVKKKRCVDTTNVTVTVFGRAGTETIRPVGEYFRQNFTILANVTDQDTGRTLAGYEVGFYDNGTLIANDTTNTSGLASVDWNAFKATAGLHKITTKIGDNASGYYNATVSAETNNVVLNASMELIRYNTSEKEVTWFDSGTPHTTNLTVFLEDEYNESLPGANVSFYSNATGTGDFMRVGTCL
ncbi:MAG: Ig-like domain-containing protein, partial [Candidatus Nanohaloarchaea archaeon]|nr:Ig-like domain-containing protein [Candidatus Nanohaloarchaea archaeon]